MFLTFKEKLRGYSVFSLKDIYKTFPKFDSRRLVEWQRKGYISKIRNLYYYFSDFPVTQEFLFLASNKIYAPSYVSLESALSYHNLIPESVYSITAVSTLKTNQFSTPLGNFSYRHLKPELFFGYQLVNYENQSLKMAGSEKAVLDFLYLQKKIKGLPDMEAIRINKDLLEETFDLPKFESYLKLFQSKALNQRVKQFLTYAYA